MKKVAAPFHMQQKVPLTIENRAGTQPDRRAVNIDPRFQVSVERKAVQVEGDFRSDRDDQRCIRSSRRQVSGKNDRIAGNDAVNGLLQGGPAPDAEYRKPSAPVRSLIPVHIHHWGR